MRDRSECILCHSSECTRVRKGVRYAPEQEVYRCNGCGLAFLWPQMTREELDRYYHTEAYREDYEDPSLEARYRADVDGSRSRARRLLPLLRPATALLEVGCGSGAFLDAVRPYVGEVHGIEPEAASREWIEKRMGFRVMPSLKDVLSGGKAFDLVVLFQVLEHIPDPIGFLQDLQRLLKPGGKLVVEVPNVEDMLVAVYRIPAYLSFYYQKAHLYYFSADTLCSTLDRAGFNAEVEGIQRYDLSNHIRWMLTAEPGGQGYYNDILQPASRAAYAEALIRAGRSDTLWAVARKGGRT